MCIYTENVPVVTWQSGSWLPTCTHKEATRSAFQCPCEGSPHASGAPPCMIAFHKELASCTSSPCLVFFPTPTLCMWLLQSSPLGLLA